MADQPRGGETMGAKHTPGPWEVVGFGDHREVQQSDPRGVNICHFVVKDEDARLIAAAPELKQAVLAQQAIIDAQAAIIMAYKIGGRTPGKALDAMVRFTETEKLARAALAKAEGVS